jgi:hypothetical protein
MIGATVGCCAVIGFPRDFLLELAGNGSFYEQLAQVVFGLGEAVAGQDAFLLVAVLAALVAVLAALNWPHSIAFRRSAIRFRRRSAFWPFGKCADLL